jgi:hypothetical protein
MFYFSLAEALGMSVADMLSRMSSKELSEWMAYNRVRKVEYENEAQRIKQESKVGRH